VQVIDTRNRYTLLAYGTHDNTDSRHRQLSSVGADWLTD
jgi:hypothetical protein